MTVSPFQPPPASMAARCQMPQVPLKGSGWPAQQRVACSMPRWASSVTICISVSAFSCGLRKSKRACTNAQFGSAAKNGRMQMRRKSGGGT